MASTRSADRVDQSAGGNPRRPGNTPDPLAPTATKVGDVAGSLGLTREATSGGFTREATSVGFIPATEDGFRIDGKKFNVSAKRTHTYETGEVTHENVDWALNPISIAEKRHWALRYSVGLPAKILKGAWFVGKTGAMHANTYRKNRSNRKTQENQDHLCLESEDKKKLYEAAKKCWEKYKEKHKLDISDVMDIKILHVIKEDGTADFTKEVCFKILTKKRDKKGKVETYPDGSAKYEWKIIFLGYIDAEDGDDCFYGVGNAIQWGEKKRVTREEYAKAIKEGKDPLATEQTEEEASAEATPRAARSARTSSGSSPRSGEVDPLICFAHAANVLRDATGTLTHQTREFGKARDIRDQDATRLRRETFPRVGQQDAQEAILLSGMIDRPERFETSATQYYRPDGPRGAEVSTGAANVQPDPVPIVEITGGHSLQDSFDHYCEDRYHDRLPMVADPRGGARPQVQITRQTRIYQKNPPFLMVTVNRTRRTASGGTEPIRTPIAVEDRLLLRSPRHIRDSAIAGAGETHLDLKGFISHDLGSADGGHYIAYVKRQIDNPVGAGKIMQWYKYDNLGDYGVPVGADDREFDERKRRAYVYLYKNPAEDA